MKDLALLVALVLAFAGLVTVHVAIVAGLARRPPRWRAALALVLPPLAPFWARAEGMRVRAVAWVVLLCAYATLLGLASR